MVEAKVYVKDHGCSKLMTQDSEVPSGFTTVVGWLVNSSRCKYCEIEGSRGGMRLPKLVENSGIWKWGTLCRIRTSITFPIDFRS